MNCMQFVFLISVALQVSGALILILFCWGNTERCLLNTIYPANSNIHREENDTVIISKEKLVNAHKKVLLNRTAFILIGIGYLLNLFGSNEGICAWEGLIIVLVASVILVAVGVMAIHIIAKQCNRKDRVYPYEEFCSKVDSEIVTNVTEAEIDEIFKV